MNYYELLEIRENASPEVVEMAYKALVRKYHPDVYRGDSHVAHDITQKINEAHAVLADPEARARYDATLDAERGSGRATDEKKSSKRRPWMQNVRQSTGQNTGQSTDQNTGQSKSQNAGQSRGFSLPRYFTAGALILFILCLVLAVVSGMLALRLSTLKGENQQLDSRLVSVKDTLSTMEANNANLQKENRVYSNDLEFYYNRACVIADYSKRYHHYGCPYLNADHAYILDVENADRLGYAPCPQCWNQDFDQFYETRTDEMDK